MNIGIDISQAAYQGTGVGRFVRGLTKAICSYDTENDWTFFFSSFRLGPEKELVQQIKQRGFRLINVKLPLKILSFLWNDLHLFPIDSVVGKMDWFITSDWIEPPATCKKATIIHDLSVFRFPETVDIKILKIQKKRLSWVAKESSLIFTDSEATKKDVEEYLSQIASSVYRIYPGVDVSSISQKRAQELLKKLELKKDFILTVGKQEPRKNLKKLVEAFQKANVPAELVIVGAYGWGERIQAEKRVKILGYVDDTTLAALYSSCLFFIYPSLWEGFGYPVVEAMKFGAPVATSDSSSLKEIANGYGFLFDPTNVKDMSESIRLLATNKKLRSELSRKSRLRAEDFAWKSYYESLIKFLNSS